nr:unnamed protein product [Digitaria exilis]
MLLLDSAVLLLSSLQVVVARGVDGLQGRQAAVGHRSEKGHSILLQPEWGKSGKEREGLVVAGGLLRVDERGGRGGDAAA